MTSRGSKEHSEQASTWLVQVPKAVTPPSLRNEGTDLAKESQSFQVMLRLPGHPPLLNPETRRKISEVWPSEPTLAKSL